MTEVPRHFHTGMGRARRVLCCMLFAALAALLCPASAARAQDKLPSEPQVKAAFLFSFPKYIDWPEAVLQSNSPIIFVIVGDAAVEKELRTMAGAKKIGDHPVIIRSGKVSEADFDNAQVVFLGRDEFPRAAEMFKKLGDAPVLAVGENEGFLDKGGMIRLVNRDRKVGMEVNLPAAQRVGLRISSRLLSVATLYKPGS